MQYKGENMLLKTLALLYSLYERNYLRGTYLRG